MSKEKEIEEMAKKHLHGGFGGDVCDRKYPCTECPEYYANKEKPYLPCCCRSMAEKLYNAGYRKQKAEYAQVLYALADMINQFAYSATFRGQDAVCDGGLSALESAFAVLDDCGCKVNSNGIITRKNLWDFMAEVSKE